VIEIEHLSKGFGDRLLIDDLSFSIPPGAIVGVIGGNGAGKTTLFRMLTGEEKPDSGEIIIGSTVALSSVDQSRDSLDGDKTVWEEIADGQEFIQVGNFKTQSRAYVGRFNFRGSDQQKRVKDLSGGERNRVHLAKVLPDRHPYARLRGRQPRGMVRRQLFRVRSRPETAPGRRSGPAPPHEVPEAQLESAQRVRTLLSDVKESTKPTIGRLNWRGRGQLKNQRMK